MPSAAARDVLQAILERRAAEKRREMAAPPMAGPPAMLPFSNRIAGAFEAAEPVRQVDELSAPITLPFAARNQLGDWGARVPNTLKAIGPMVDPRTSPFGPAAVARLFMDPAGEAGRQVETGEQLAKPFTQFNDPNVDPVKQGTDLALTVMGGSSVVPAETNSLRMGIKAYHGSPHDFERFDSSKIGTGEGAQAYGHGMYFAEREGVAQDYKKNLARGVDYKGTGLNIPEGPEGSAVIAISNKIINAVDPQEAHAATIKEYVDAAASARKIAEGQKGDVRFANLDRAKSYEAIADAAKRVDPADFSYSPGRMYEVDIAAEPEHFLDWDKPLAEQPKAVQGALDTFLAPSQVKSQKSRDQTLHQIYGRGMPPETDNPIGSVRERGGKFTAFRESMEVGTFDNLPDAQKAVEKAYGDPPFWGRITSQEGASALREAGVPGIKYLDQGSRKGTVIAADGKPTGYPNIDAELSGQFFGNWQAFKNVYADSKSPVLKQAIKEIDARGGIKWVPSEEGTRNYVIFPGNEHLISILRKYGLPISAAGLAALSQLHPQEAQAAQQQNLPRY